MANAANGSAEGAPAYFILDTESVPDGRLLALVRYAGEELTDEQAVARAQEEARRRSGDTSDFVPVSFHFPVAVCVARVGADFRLQSLSCLDADHFRPREMTELFWKGMAHYEREARVKLVTFNGRGFDLPLLELSAFRFGCCSAAYFERSRNRFKGHLDLLDWLTNYGAYRLSGGLNLLSKLLGKPGKKDTRGDQVYDLYRSGQVRLINDYCLADVLDTYFVFLRTRVLTAKLSLAEEQDLVRAARDWLTTQCDCNPACAAAVRRYLEHWGDWQPWPV